MSRGRFIAFEGGEAAGKSTQAARYAAAHEAFLTREPGATILGARIRQLVLSPDTNNMNMRAEALLMAADRAQHVSEMIEPILSSGRDVITDRYAGSTLAYQGYGRGLPLEELRSLSHWASAGLWPDLTILCVVPPEVAQRRLVESGRAMDRMETAGADFHKRVAEGFLDLAATYADTWRVVDGTGEIEAVATRIEIVASVFFQPAFGIHNLDLDTPAEPISAKVEPSPRLY